MSLNATFRRKLWIRRSGRSDLRMAWNHNVLWSQRRRRNAEDLADLGLRVRDFSSRSRTEEASFMWVEVSRTTSFDRPMSTGTIVDPGHRLWFLLCRSARISHRLGFIRADNLSSQQWGLKS